MPRLSSKELQEAKRKKAEERRQVGQQQRVEMEEYERRMEQRKVWLANAKEQLPQLESAVQGLYDEVSKISNKWPSMPVSKYQLERTNKAIAAVRGLMAGENDQFIDDINEIVPAGDMPEGRDVTMVLRQLKDALARFKAKHRFDLVL